jgi:ribosomal protein S18 acetylase RimI-like enzyme
MMKIEMVTNNKKKFLDLLLLADEQENLIDRYLERGDMFALYDGDLKSICVVTNEGQGIYELKNIATYEKYQGLGYGKKLISHLLEYYNGHCQTLIVGTGDNSAAILFYEQCGFTFSHRVRNFFTDHYDHPIFEDGRQLIDMIYLRKDLKSPV